MLRNKFSVSLKTLFFVLCVSTLTTNLHAQAPDLTEGTSGVPAAGATAAGCDAQVAAEKTACDEFKSAHCTCEEVEEDPEAWDLSAAFGFNLTSGNTDTVLLTGSFHADKEVGDNAYLIDIIGAQGEQDLPDSDETVKTQEYIRGDASWRHSFNDTVYSGFGVAALTDQIADIKYRVFLNPLLGLYLYKADDDMLAFEAGPSYVFQKQGDDTDSFLAPRIALNGSWELSETSKISHTTEAFLNVDDSEDILVNTAINLESSLSTNLALVLSVIDRYDNVPLPGIERNDVLVTSSLKVAL